MRKLLLLGILSMVAMLVLSPAALAQNTGPYGCPEDRPFVATAPGDPGEGSLRCFATQAQANFYSATGQVSQTATPTATQTATPTTTATTSPTPTATSSPTPTSTASPTASPTATALAPTGGPSLAPLVALAASLLLIGGGILSLAIIRRTS